MITEFENICVICGNPRDEVHHLVFGRGMRELADSDLLTAPCCQKCHKAIHYNGTAGKLSKIIGQMEYEKQMILAGSTSQEARESFRERYGRSYL